MLIFLLFIPGFVMSTIQTPPLASTITDGPYISYHHDWLKSQYIQEENGLKSIKADSVKYSGKQTYSFDVPTDVVGKTFKVTLKKKLEIEKAEYNKVPKTLIVSDIEANFKAFRTLLQGNGVIDQDFKWTFGDGHLVLTGDFFDRGHQQTEVLWLIYHLEDQAKTNKGYVHFILGNHEIMNLNGDLRYVHPKYFEHAKLMQRTYLSLYDHQTELGRWLRTKNIIEKVGDVLCMHGGISSYINQIAFPVTKLNAMARPYYADTSYQYPDVITEVLFSDEGPFWYRGYYTGSKRASQGQVDSTLQLFNCKYITTGHTIVGDRINTYYNNKIFNTDVSHAKGISQALYIENNKYYRVSQEGKRDVLIE